MSLSYSKNNINNSFLPLRHFLLITPIGQVSQLRKSPHFRNFFRVGRNPYEVCLHSSLKLPGGDTLLDVHPTLLKVLCKGCIPPNPFCLEGDEGRAKRCISARSDRSEDGGAPRKGSPLHLNQKITMRVFVSTC